MQTKFAFNCLMSIWLKDIKDQNVFWRVTGSWNYAQPKNDKRLFWQQKGWNLKAKQTRWITHFLDNKLSFSQNYALFSAGPGFHAFLNFLVYFFHVWYFWSRTNGQKNENSYWIFIQECIFMWIRTGSVEFSIHMVFNKEAYSQRVPFSNKCLKYS